jgi:hypothetical protein
MIENIDTKINQLQDASIDALNVDVGNIQFNENKMDSALPVDVPTEGTVFVEQEEPILVAGGKKGVIERILKETLNAPGARVERDIKVKKEVLKVTPNIQPEPIATPTIVPPAPKKLKLSPEQEVMDISQRRQEIINEGAAPVAPVPSKAQLVQGVQEGQLSTVPYDEPSMRATLQSLSESYLKEPNAPVTINELYESAIQRGLPKRAVKNLLSGIPFESKVGDYQLAKNAAGLVRAMDESTSYVDNLMAKLENDTANFTDTDMFNLSQQMAIGKALEETVLSAGSDVSATMNVYRRAKETMSTLGGAEFRQFLDGVINKDEALKLAKLYNNSKSVAAKNKLITGQKGLLTKLADGAWYTYQSNLLSDVGTWASNFTGATVQNALMIGEEFLIAGVTSPIRRAITGAKDGYYLEDVFNGVNGLYNGIADGWISATQVVKTGQRAGFKSQGKVNPLTAENFSNTPLLSAYPNFAVTPDLTDTWVGKLINGAGYFQEHSFRALAAGDEVTSTAFAGYALRREASAFARNRLDELKKAGKSDDEAYAIVKEEVAEFKDTQPIDIYKNVEETRQLANLSYAWDKTYTLDRAYSRIEAALQAPIMKTFIPFAPTVTRVFDQAASRVPGMQVISPQFYKDVSRGGVYADRAAARVISGGIIPTMLISTGTLENRITGAGPSDPQLKKSLEATGWQEYSIAFNRDSFSDENLNRLKKIAVVTESTDKQKIYVSYQRFDQVGQIIGAAADYAESLKMYTGNPDDEEWSKYALATAAYMSEFTSQLPVMQFVGDLTSISRGNYEDKGEKATEIFEKFATALGTRAFLSIPIVGYAAGTQSAHIAKLIDPEQRTKMADTMAAGDAKAALEKIRNTIAGRIPLLRGEVEMELDNAGRPQIDRASFNDVWINGLPFVKAKLSRKNEMDEMLQSAKMGISKPSSKWEGVSLGAEQFNKYKKLYGQEIKLPTPVYVKDENGNETLTTQMYNMEKAIPLQIASINKEREKAGLPELLPNEKRKEITNIISTYRDFAQKRMIGEKIQTQTSEYYSGEYYDIVQENGRYNVVKKAAEYPELVEKINQYKSFSKTAPVPELIPQVK